MVIRLYIGEDLTEDEASLIYLFIKVAPREYFADQLSLSVY